MRLQYFGASHRSSRHTLQFLLCTGRTAAYGIRAPSCSPFVQLHSFCFLVSVTTLNLFTDTRTCCNANRFLVQSRLSSWDRGNKGFQLTTDSSMLYIINVTGLPQYHNKLRVRGRCFCFDLFFFLCSGRICNCAVYHLLSSLLANN